MRSFLWKQLTDRKFRRARIWSNTELARFAPLYRGSVVNVSGWRDQDKEGRLYREYFSGCSEYAISNYRSEACGFQGDLENEFFLDLEEPLPMDMAGGFDVVFNHTTLEHVFEVRRAFANLCALSRDTVITVTPFLQQQHEAFGDFWRFTPLTLRRMIRAEGLHPVYMSWNDDANCSVYVFSIASRHPDRWERIAGHPANRLAQVDETFIGCGAVTNSWLFRLRKRFFGAP